MIPPISAAKLGQGISLVHERQEASMNSLKEKMARLFRREATAKDDQFEERLKRLTAAKPARPLSRYSRNPVLFRRDMASV